MEIREADGGGESAGVAKEGNEEDEGGELINVGRE